MKPAVWIVLAVAVLGALVALEARFRPVDRTETLNQVLRETTRLQQLVQAGETERATLRQQIAAQQTVQANVATSQRETIYRGDAAQIAALLAGRSAPAPVVINVPQDQAAPVVVQQPAAPVPIGAGGPAPNPAPSPVEIIIRDTRTDDTSRTEARTEVKTEARQERQAETKTETKQETQAEVKTEVKVETAAPEGPGNLGIGYLTGAAGDPAPFVSYDLVQRPLGPRLLGLDQIRLGLGLFGTYGGGLFDGGPQANVGKGSVFGMLGYRVRQQDPVIGVGIKLRF